LSTGHFSCIVNVFDYNNSLQASANYCFVSRTEVVSSLALAIDTCISANLTIQPKNSKKNFICNYSDFQQYVATTPVLFLSFYDPQLKNPGSSPESNKTVVMKLHHNCIF